MTGFDLLSPIYDTLNKVIFFGRIQKAQKIHLYHIPPKSDVLILGGGTGWILTEILDRSSEVNITYVELSRGMTARAKRRSFQYRDRIEFVREDARLYSPTGKYDVIITNFFFDMFPPAQINKIIENYTRSMRKGAIWMLADFIPKRDLFVRSLVSIMYTFFKLICGIQAGRLYNYHQFLLQAGWQEEQTSFFYMNMIRSSVYRLKGPSE